MAAFAANAAASLVEDVFMYNRNNFQYDRKQRQLMEYQLADMKIEQAQLWRTDVRQFCGLTPKKLEIYLLVIALELGFCVMALCKARVPPGIPCWLVACHTLSVCSALMYLFLALWFGMHAFVSAQAYKVRLLTQMVRLPVPSWQGLEASRTYGSSFERLEGRQMLRVPLAMNHQGCNSGSAGPPVADPWGLERCGGNQLTELAPDVNISVERQRHVWLMREAAKFYQTYDAFCRISMSAGTCQLATFFSYHCMTYVLTENAAPVAAWAGMCIFMACALSLMRCDLALTGWQYLAQGTLLCLSPSLSFIVTLESSRHAGNVGRMKAMVIVSLLLHGYSLVNHLILFQMRETQTGAVLPTAFRKILYIDPFGWARHHLVWWRRYRDKQPASSETRFVRSASLSPGGFLQSRAMEEDSEVPSSLPASQCLNSSSPLRPEDVEERDTAAVQEDSPIKRSRNSFRPGTFAEAECSPRPDAEKRQIQTGVDIHGEKPGLVPWRIFFVNTVFLACAWEAAALEAMIKSFQSNMIFHQSMKIATYGLQPGQVLPLPALFGSRVETNWQNGLNHPRGLVCDSTGTNFVTSARAPDGNDGFVTGRLSLLGSHRSLGVDFGPASPCSGGGQLGGQSVQDLSSISCTSDGCIASVLPRRGTQLVRCSTANQGTNATGKNATGVQIGPRPQLALSAVPLSRAWLDDRGGIAEDSSDESPLALHPEEIASAVTFPCGNSSLSGMQRTTPSECMAVSTTAKRLVALELANMAPQGPTWTPTAVLSKGMGEVPEPGELAVVGNRYLVTLRTQKGVLEAMDLQRGGASVGSWRLSASAAPGQRWGPICAAGGALFVLEDGQNPGLWRFQTPPELQAQLAR